MIAQTDERRLQRDRQAFTLVELLVVITIITILASTALFTLYGVREDVRETRTRTVIARVNEVIMEKWESYRMRAVPLRIPAGTPPRVAAAHRLNAIRELMRMELPDRVTDLRTVVDTPNGAAASNTLVGPVVLNTAPAAWRGYQRRIAANVSRGNVWTVQHEQSECLYMILAGIREGDSTGLDAFEESEIGDTDGDGMPEVLDPWGRPIYFLRWAPGYVSALQNPQRREPDPFDPLRVDPRWENNDDSNPATKRDDPFALYPVIYSGGRDGQFGVVLKDYDNADPPNYIDITYALSDTSSYANAELSATLYPSYTPYPTAPWSSGSSIWTSRPKNDPYLILPTSRDYIGRILGTSDFASTGLSDDITNHLLEVR